MRDYTRDFLELVRLAATDLPPDVERPAGAGEREAHGSAARGALDTILKNVDLARRQVGPPSARTPARRSSTSATRKAGAPASCASRSGPPWPRPPGAAYLRPNAVDSLTGKNSGNNLGDEAFPTIHFEEVEGDELAVDLLLKGGGCENVGAQYSLPNSRPGRRPRPGGRAQGGARCRVPGPGPGLRAGRTGRGHRRRPRLVVLRLQGGALPQAGRAQPRPGIGRAGDPADR